MSQRGRKGRRSRSSPSLLEVSEKSKKMKPDEYIETRNSRLITIRKKALSKSEYVQLGKLLKPYSSEDVVALDANDNVQSSFVSDSLS